MADTMTITEALAEIKTIGKRIEKKQDFILSNLLRQDMLKDPLDKDGGSVSVVAAERQAVADLQIRIVAIRRAIDKANVETAILVNGTTRSIAEWLIWKREVAPARQTMLARMRQQINQTRQQATAKGFAVVNVGESTKPQDVIVNINENKLAAEIEDLETTLGTLDGQLSLKNATVMVTI